MSLSARIALEPSRRLAWAERSLAIGGVVVACAASAQRWPTLWPVWLMAAFVACTALESTAARRRRHERSRMLAVSDRVACDLFATRAGDDAWVGGSCRLSESTMLWPGFAMLALVRDGERRVVRIPVDFARLAAHDRRALGRFLLWSMRDGGGRRHLSRRASAQETARRTSV